MKRLALIALIVLAGCGGDEEESTEAETTPTPTTTTGLQSPQEAGTLMQKASRRLDRSSDIIGGGQCERKAEVEEMRDDTRTDIETLEAFAEEDGRAQVKRLVNQSTRQLEVGIDSANEFLVLCR